MRNLFRILAIGVALISVCSLPASTAVAQTIGYLEGGVDYSYLRANVPPGGCSCFSANGGDAWLGYRLTSKLSVVGEIASQHASNIDGSSEDLTLTTFLLGPRYSYRCMKHFVPFGELLLGAAHADGSLSPANSGLNASSNAFAMETGGGLDLPVTKRISIRAARADYYLTTFANGKNDHQNNLRISAGVVLNLR